MRVTVAEAAREAEVTPHQIRAALREGALHARHVFGREPVLDDISVLAWKRSRSLGRRWSPRATAAALDLLSDGTTAFFSGSELSRLRRVLRSSTVNHIAYLAGGLGGAWARFRPLEELKGLEPMGPTAANATIPLGITGTREMTFAAVPDLNLFEREVLVAPDAEGTLGVVERPLDTRGARILLDTYLVGDSRESAIAADLLQERADAL